MIPFAVRIVCNVAAGQLVKYLAARSPQEIEEWKQKAVEWWKQDRDLSELIPLDFKIPDHIKRRIIGRGFAGRVTRRVLDAFAVKVDGACPAYDLILQYVHDIAGNFRRGLDGKRPEAAEVMRQVQVIAAWLGNERVRPWYYKNMERAYARIADQLVGEYGEGTGDPGN